MLLNIIVLIKL